MWTNTFSPPQLKHLVTLALLAVYTVQSISAEPGLFTYSDNNYVEFLEGSLPILLTVPHGGMMRPQGVPDRTNFVDNPVSEEANTIAFAKLIIEEIAYITNGSYPWAVICHLHRSKVDVDAEFLDGTQNLTDAAAAWHAYHDFIMNATNRFEQEYGTGQLFDIRVHSHDTDFIEIGFDIPKHILNMDDAALSHPEVIANSSLARIATSETFAAMVRGPHSIGGLLQALNVEAIPSPAHTGPGDNQFNDGATYTIRTWGSRNNQSILNAAQISFPQRVLTMEDSAQTQVVTNFVNASITWHEFNLYNSVKIQVLQTRNNKPNTTLGDVFAIIFAVVLAIGIVTVAAWIIVDWRRRKLEVVTQDESNR